MVAPKIDMDKVKDEIKEVKNEHPDWDPKNNIEENPFIVGDLPKLYAKLNIKESDFGKKAEVFDVSDNAQVIKARAELDDAMKRAMSAKKGSAEARVAWDEVEELEASVSHLKDRLQNEVPSNIKEIRTQIKQTLEEIESLKDKQRVAYDTLEELDAALSHAMKKKAPKVAKNMEFIKA